MTTDRKSHRVRFGAILWTLIGTAIAVGIAWDVANYDPETDAGVNIDLGDEADSEDQVAVARGGSGEGVNVAELTHGGASEPPTFEELLIEWGSEAARSDFELQDFRDALRRERFETNVRVLEVVVEPRVRWIQRFERVLKYVGLAGLLLLFGPLWLYRRMEGQPDRRRTAVRSAPYFAVAAAVTVLLATTLVDLVIAIQVVQTLVAGIGSLTVASTDATMHYLIYTEDADFIRLMGLLADARTMAETNPFESLHMMEYLWTAAAQAEESRVFRAVGHLIDSATWLVDLYGPLLGVAATVVTFGVAYPIVRNLVRYPTNRLTGEDARSPGRFLWEQIKVLWREVRAFFWMILVILLVTLFAVAVVRAMTIPIVAVLLRVLFAAQAHVEAGGTLPDVGILVSAASLTLTMVALVMTTLGPAAVVVSRAYRVVRARLLEKRGFLKFPGFWELVGTAITRVGLRVILAAGLTFALYAGVNALLGGSALARIWLPGPVFAPVLVTLLWLLRVPRELIRFVKVDVLRAPQAR